ncbi:MAG: hypothetical protein IKP35_00580 [Alphaproteobacteria bacterium]|nr:hypothetical protein [Alphaproteobacteria bacterium]
MKLKRKFLLVILLCLPFCNAYGAGSDETSLASSVDAIANAPTPQEAKAAKEAAEKQAAAETGVQPPQSNTNDAQNSETANTGVNTATQPADNPNDDSTESTDGNTGTKELSAAEKQKLKDKKSSFEDAKANEQSLANRTLTAATTAATGIGGMQLAQGLAEQKADKAAEQNMDAYIATFRCTYGNGKQVKASSTEIELPGGNDATMMKYRDEYFALAQSLKVRKAALEMAPGIEAEEIMDKSQMGLYDDENVGLTDGTYSSLYRAKMLGSEKDQQQIDEEKKKSKNRVIAGAVVGGVGVVGGVVGNSLINGKIGEKLKESIKNKKAGKETQALLKKEVAALDDLKKCLKSAGVKDTDNLTFKEFYPSVLLIKGMNCKNDLLANDMKDKSANELFHDSSTNTEYVLAKLKASFGEENAGRMIGCKITETNGCVSHLQSSLDSVKKAFKEAEENDKEEAKSLGIDLSDFATGAGEGLGSAASMFGGSLLSKITGTTTTDEDDGEE